ncbi:MAG: quinone-dependent dihydroorotate dehydrogenase [SAR86 cluster bacterium]|uniref:Dihydroorotate dehydrogenase (quinone) n=1 Tax=SAR86 cluster bacterium TaxID=2030880 RepID=A0A937I7A3_9GAMM|nr:quinone-dependent dihydroorotate dehydrogenase [SAR86 cluster bacterium]
MIKFLEELALIILRFFPAEAAKKITLILLKIVYGMNLIGFFASSNFQKSKINIKNLSFKNRIGIAGGLDKNAEYFHIFNSLGFGFVEVGTVTLEPQKGNPKPRIFRFSKDKTLVNSLGFNNAGSVQVLKNIKKYKPNFDGVLGISIGKSKNTKTKNAWQDYLHLMDYFYLEADYLAINISSPNTENLRELSSQENFEFLLKKISQKKVQLVNMHKKNTPIFVKLSPDETDENLKNLIEVSEKNSIDGFICCNTTTDHIYPTAGGMSGAMLSKKAGNMQKKVAEFKQEKSILIASGGVMNANDVKERLINSADLVQLYTGYIYQGNSLLKKALQISSS